MKKLKNTFDDRPTRPIRPTRHNDFKNLTTEVTFFKNGLQLDGPRVYF